MASGAQPCSNQRSSRKSRRHVGSCSLDAVDHRNDQCVVCGDRACSHHYYGVAACHGCKCFFWRSVKTNAQYVCRFGGNCAIDVNGRNTCRKCRFDRCLRAGMKPEAVRMEKVPLIVKNKPNTTKDLECRENVTNKGAFSTDGCTKCESLDPPKVLMTSTENAALINLLVEIDRTISKGVSEPSLAPPAQNLREAFAEPYRLDYDRTPIMSVHLEEADFFAVQDMFPKSRRMLVGAIDWILFLTAFDVRTTVDEKMLLLRNCFAPLAVLELCMLAANMLYKSAKLGLSGDKAFIASTKYLKSCFLNSGPVETRFTSLVEPICLLQLDEKEIALMKAIVCFNPEIDGLSFATIRAISALSDRIHNTLYHRCTEHYVNTNATIRFAKLLRLLSKITTVATQLEQLIQLSHAFRPEQQADPLIRELLGDICDDRSTLLSCSRSSDTTSASASPIYPDSPIFREKCDSS